jgi:glycosyltransferase involved in cell wall biosynthesis|tara:strand:+ start:5596 stop:6567 length:972 start_codon:yes stop_codon:yes gene_type:complete
LAKIIHTVIVVSYNHEDYISKALDSILLGSRIADQIIIVDDCSTDSTFNIIKKYQEQYPLIIEATQNLRNLGIFENLNKIYDRSVRGNIISFLGGDDYYDKSLLSEIDIGLNKAKINPNYDSFMTLPNVANLFIDGSIQNLKNTIYNASNKSTPFQLALRGKLYSMHVGISISLYRNWARFPKNAMRDVGLYADLPHYLDNVKACKLFIPIEAATTYHRVGVGATSISHLLSPQESRYRALMLIKKRFSVNLNLSDKVYIYFIMAIDSIYFSKTLFGFLKCLMLLPVGILIDGVDRRQYLKTIKTLFVDATKKIQFFFRNYFL